MEIWDLYDKNRTATGETAVRGGKLAADRYRMVVHVCLFNAAGEMLIQHRQPSKTQWPDRWDISVGGHVVSGETSSQGAEREVLEELGLRLDLDRRRPSLTVNFDTGFDDVYLVRTDHDIPDMTLQAEEVSAVRWASADAIFAMIDSGEFIPYHKSLIQLLFDMKDFMGMHQQEK